MSGSNFVHSQTGLALVAWPLLLVPPLVPPHARLPKLGPPDAVILSFLTSLALGLIRTLSATATPSTHAYLILHHAPSPHALTPARYELPSHIAFPISLVRGWRLCVLPAACLGLWAQPHSRRCTGSDGQTAPSSSEA